MEGCAEWQGTCLENKRAKALRGSSPLPSATKITMALGVQTKDLLK